MLDESGSIDPPDFTLMKSFLSQLVARLDIDSGNTRVGLVTFSSTIGTTIDLNAHPTVTGLQSAISSLSQAALGTDTGSALAHVRTMMLTSAAGDRPDVPNVVVVLTDGRSYNTTATKVSIEFTERFLSQFAERHVMTDTETCTDLGHSFSTASQNCVTHSSIDLLCLILNNFS